MCKQSLIHTHTQRCTHRYRATHTHVYTQAETIRFNHTPDAIVADRESRMRGWLTDKEIQTATRTMHTAFTYTMREDTGAGAMRCAVQYAAARRRAFTRNGIRRCGSVVIRAEWSNVCRTRALINT